MANSSKAVVIHYGEIALKGKNRDFFEKRLITAINAALKNLIATKALRKYGRIIVPVENNEKEVKRKLRDICGIKYFAFAEVAPLEVDEMKKVALALIKKSKGSFKIATSRSNKNFALNSIQINEIVGEYILEKAKMKVNLTNPDITIFIEICEKESYLYSEKIKGIGGLPIVPSEKVISLLSGGIDSAAASFLMMKRGCKVIFLHFVNSALHSSLAQNKIIKMVEALVAYQLNGKLYVVPFDAIQKEIIKKIPAKYRMIVYRRYMMKIANEIASMEKSKAIVTGDNVAQVASQTLDNLKVIYSASSLPVLSPLIGFDKEEIVKLAKNIRTYEISITPYEDCCSFMIAKHPETKGKIKSIQRMESELDSNGLIIDSVKKAKTVVLYPKQ